MGTNEDMQLVPGDLLQRFYLRNVSDESKECKLHCNHRKV